jgi:ABC-type Na+ efflux pump permease subunit
VIVMHADAVIPSGERGAYGTYDFLKPSTLDERTEGTINESVREAVVGARLSYEKLDQHDIDAIVRVEPPGTRVLTSQGKDEVAHPTLNRLIPFVLLMFLFMGTFTGAGSLLSTTVEEKFNRVMEVLLSAVSPFELMVGKILGQLAVTGVVMTLYVSLGMLVLSSFAVLGLVEPMLLVYLLIFSLTTYLIVGAFMGAVGAAVNDLRDAQTLLLPLNLVMMLPWLLAFPVSANPDSTLSVVMSFVPPVNSFAMLLRLASSSPPPTWQVLVSILISLASALVALWFASKIFRIALLFHGKPPNLATFIRWARAA